MKALAKFSELSKQSKSDLRKRDITPLLMHRDYATFFSDLCYKQ